MAYTREHNRSLLLLNWRDPWHPQAGGAEILTLRIMERLAARGWRIEWFSAAYKGAAPSKVRNGIHFVRGGSQLTVHLHALARYWRDAPFDYIVDEVNTVPFYAMLYGRNRHVMFINQLARGVWLYELPHLLGYVGEVLEPLLLAPYRRTPVITISESTRESLIEIGFRGPIGIIPMAADEEPLPVAPAKIAEQDIITVSRLAPSKRLEHAIHAASDLRARGWLGKLHIVGAGRPKYDRELRELAERLAPDTVIFHGRVGEKLRTELLRKCTALWMTSVREGWGLVITEAALNFTPTAAYNVPGIRDAVQDGSTGVLTSESPRALAAATWALLVGNVRSVAESANTAARQLSWDATADRFEHLLECYGRRTGL